MNIKTIKQLPATKDLFNKVSVCCDENGNTYNWELNDLNLTFIKGDGVGSAIQAKEVETFVDETPDSLTNGQNIPTEASGDYSVVLNGKSKASGKRALAQGNRTIAYGDNSHTEGHCTQTLYVDEITNGYAAHAEGYGTFAAGTYSHAEGNRTVTRAPNSHAEGYLCSVDLAAESSHAEGYGTGTFATASHSEGNNTKTHKAYSHAEGRQTETFGEASHTEGNETITEGDYAHAEGWMTRAKGAYSHSEGQYTFTYADAAHSEGNNTHAQAPFSHAEGLGTKTNPVVAGQHVEGYYNHISDGVKIIGCGTSDENRKNAIDVKQDGRIFIKGLGNYDGVTNDAVDLKTVIDSKANSTEVYNKLEMNNIISRDLVRKDYIKTINGLTLIGSGNIDIDFTPMTTVTYSELVNLRDNGVLISGQQYRITDYVTTTTQSNTQAAGHQFDLIVTADDESTLNENARVIQHDGDTYFSEAGANLESWELKYCLDNDTERFAWADNSFETIYDSSNCNIKSDLIDGNLFVTPFAFSRYMWDNPVNGEEYDINGDDLVYYWGFEEGQNGSQSLFLCKSDNDESVDYQDKFYYRGVVEVDEIEYDCWQKWECGYDIGGRQAFALTERIVEGEVIQVSIPNGKGVIYYMKDEHGNECPYDFKNIMFIRYQLGAPATSEYSEQWINQLATNISNQFTNNRLSYIWGGIDESDRYWEVYFEECYSSNTGTTKSFYTFSNIINDVVSDISMTSYCQNNVIKENSHFNKLYLNNNVFFNTSTTSHCEYNTFGDNCYSNSFGDNCCSNTFRHNCHAISFGNNCCSNSFGNNCRYNSFGDNYYSNSFGDYCESNSFGNGCYSNSFGNYCDSNSFGYYCSSNSFRHNCHAISFGNNCYSNSFGDYCSSNSFGYNCESNSFGHDCDYNSFGNSCRYNTFGNNCRYNTFGDYCNSNTFGNGCYSNSLKSYYRYIIFDNGNRYINLNCTTTTSSSNCYQNVRIGLGVNNTSTYKTINDSNVGQTYETYYKPANSQTITI